MYSTEKTTSDSSVTIEAHDSEVNGQTIHYLRGGSGSVLLLVHGYPESSKAWHNVMAELAKTYTVIAPDTRGVGNSSIADNFSIEDVADDLYGLVKQLGYEKISLVGHDMGVQIVSAYAAKHRDDISALVVIESPLSSFGLEDLYSSFWHFGFLASSFSELLISGKEQEFFTAWAFGTFVFRKEAFPQATIDRYTAAQKDPKRLRAGLAYYRAVLAGKEFFAKTVLPSWAFPVLAIDGDHSMNGLTAQSFKQVVTNLESLIVPECGHFVPEEQPDLLARAVFNFLSKNVK